MKLWPRPRHRTTLEEVEQQLLEARQDSWKTDMVLEDMKEATQKAADLRRRNHLVALVGFLMRGGEMTK